MHYLVILSISWSMVIQIAVEQGFLTNQISGKAMCLSFSDIPNLVTNSVMIRFARFRSLSPFVVTQSLKCSSAALPAKQKHTFPIRSSFVVNPISSLIVCEYPFDALENGNIDSLIMGSDPSVNHPTTAFPLSQQASMSFYQSEKRLRFSRPAITRQVAFQNLGMSMDQAPSLAANIAAQLHMLASSAPLNPGVNMLILLANYSIVNLESNFTFFKCTWRIYFLYQKLGRPIQTERSKRPGRSRAGSRVSLMLVAAMTITLFLESNPSILTSNWFSVLSLSQLANGPESLFLPIASISSMNIIDGAFFSASSNSFLTLEAPKPTYFQTKSEPETQQKGTPAYPAHALARRVLPVPGGPVRRAPLGTLAPIQMYFQGYLRKSTNSVIQNLASCIPATSAKSVLIFSGLIAQIFLLSISNIFCPPDPFIIFFIPPNNLLPKNTTATIIPILIN